MQLASVHRMSKMSNDRFNAFYEITALRHHFGLVADQIET